MKFVLFNDHRPGLLQDDGEDEDYNIAVFVSETTDRAALQDGLYDLIFSSDDTHGTSSLCYVWPARERPYIVSGSQAAQS